MRLSMLGIWLAVVASVGCDSSNGGSSGDFACGDTRCQASEICLTPAYGCLAFPLTDAGVCPEGSTYSDAGNDCVQTPPKPSCVVPNPGEGSFDCSAADASVNCSVVNAPIPATCSRMCRSICA